MDLAKILLEVKQDDDGLWRIYSTAYGHCIRSLGAHKTKDAAYKASKDFFNFNLTTE